MTKKTTLILELIVLHLFVIFSGFVLYRWTYSEDQVIFSTPLIAIIIHQGYKDLSKKMHLSKNQKRIFMLDVIFCILLGVVIGYLILGPFKS